MLTEPYRSRPTNRLPPIPTGQPAQLCPRHEFAPVVKYCTRCSTAVCPVCIDSAEHDTHQFEIVSLNDLSSQKNATSKQKWERTDALIAELDRLITDVPILQQQLHRRVDEELDDVIRAIDQREAALLADVDRRTENFQQTLVAEIERCEKELAAVQDIQHTLTLMAERGGDTNGEGANLLRSKISYRQYLEKCDAPLSQPKPLYHPLKLLLNTETLVDQCSSINWTENSLASCPQIYPPAGIQ
jgi:hypothetical protein